LLEGDRLAGGALGRLAHEDRAWLGDRLQPAGRVDEVARDHALVRGTEGNRCLAGQDAGAGFDRRPKSPHRIDQLERRPDRPFGIVLVGRWRTPDRHDRVTDELLDGAAVAADHVAGKLEVARQELPGVLRVASLGQGREADQVGKQDRDETALGGWRLAHGRSARSCGG